MGAIDPLLLITQLPMQDVLNRRWLQPFCLAAFALPGILVGPDHVQARPVILDFSLPRSPSSSQSSPTLPLGSEAALSFKPSQYKPPAAKHSPTEEVAPSAEVITSYATRQVKTLPKELPELSPQVQSLFQGGPDSVVARGVGSAEGTRKPNGDRTWAYYGHRDPGNGHWNLGSFSYQHLASSPADADTKQLNRLQNQARQLQLLAEQQQLKLSLAEALNGIDLANQAPLAALDRGYIPRLAEARRLALDEVEGILYARTWSYWDPDFDRWDAPGLGNQWLSISEDQQRRQAAIAQTLTLMP